MEITVGTVCSCMPACSVLFRHHLPLFVAFKSYLVSRVRIFSSRFSIRGRSSGDSSSRHFFSLGGSKKSASDRHIQPEMSDKEAAGLKKLPVVSTGMHMMWTARSFIMGSRKDRTVDEAEDSVYFARDSS